MKRILAAGLAFFSMTAMVVTTDVPVHNLYRGPILVGSFPTHDACVTAAVARNVSTAYECRAASLVTTTVTPDWIKIVPEGGVFNLPKATTVRYGSGQTWVTLSLTGQVVCAYAAFNSDPTPGVVKECDLGPADSGTVIPKPASETLMVTCPAGSVTGAQWQQSRDYAPSPSPVFWSPQAWTPTAPQTGTCPPAVPPVMHGGIMVDTSVPFPLGGVGRDVEMVLSPPGGNLAPGSNDTGDFRTVCEFSHLAFDDPIVYPGRPGAAHLHSFVGNTGTDANSTYDNMGSAKSTCRGGTVNLSAYWVPAIIDTATNLPVKDRVFIIYYKQGNGDLHPELVQAFPKGLRMIAGNPGDTAGVRWGPAGFSCNGLAVAFDSSEPFNGGNHVIPDSCPTDAQGTHELWRAISFPDCWDGVNLDSPDHKSHMSYWPSPNRNPDGTSRETCPPDHPVKLPQLTIIAITVIPPGADISKWNLSCQMSGQRGACMHGDVMERWNRNGGPNKNIDRFQQFVDGCLRKKLDCGASLLDANTEILGFDGS